MTTDVESDPAAGADWTVPILAALGVTRTFDDGRVRPLVDVTVKVRPGELLGLVGSSGSGKTTLLNLFGLLDRPEAGTIVVAGQRASALGERARAQVRASRLGFVFQDSLIDPRRTAQENVQLALLFAGVPREQRAQRAADALDAADIAHRANTLAGELSGGERQRVALARAIAHRPPVLLCDEPTGNLDDVNTGQVFDLLAGYARAGAAVVLATHDLDLARRCTRVLSVAHGAVKPWSGAARP